MPAIATIMMSSRASSSNWRAFLLAQAKKAGAEGDVKVFVDTAPVMEKPLAAASGLGWQGKHTNLVSRDFGSWLFLGSIFTTLELPPDPAESDHCGQCRACLDACPTGALDAPYRIDARACISYLTIEAKEQIPLAYREKIGNRIYGCDDCLAVCPWNKFAQTAREAKFSAREDLVAPSLASLVAMDDAQFRAFFAGGPVKRIGHARFLRNVRARHRQFRRCFSCPRRCGAARSCFAAGARHGGMGAGPLAFARKIPGLFRASPARK